MRRPKLELIGIALAAVLASAAAQAQTGYPSKPITLIVAFAAGGDSDLSGRNLAQHVQKYLDNQPIVVVNRIGASGQIRPAADTQKFMHEQYELYERIAISLGVRQ